MTATFDLVESLHSVTMLIPQVGVAGVTSDYISLKNAHMAWVVIDFTEGAGEGVTFTLLKATAVLPSNSTAFVAANNAPIWSNLDSTASDRLVERTAGITYLTNSVASGKRVIFKIDPASLGELAGTGPYDCIAFSTTLNAGDYISAVCWILPRYAEQASTALTALTD